VTVLPLLPSFTRHAPLHHSDPFDRLLIAQARTEGLIIITADRKFEPYRVSVHWI
jgi:PIN domain nuclease of toxin-antitoxin system